MSWTSREVGQLLELAEAGLLEPAEFEQAARLGELKPTRDAWLDAADRLFVFAGVLLIATAVIFFFAWNWADMHRFTKLGVAVAALAGCTATAFFSRPFGLPWRAALLGAAVTTGAALALVGQIYQTGADVWELFAAWAVLMLPFVLLARSTASWCLWLVVANAALLRFISETAWINFVGALFAPRHLLIIAALNVALLLAFEVFPARLLEIPRRHVHRLAALGVIAPLTFGACIGWWEREFLPVTIGFVAVATIMAGLYYRPRRDLPILALAVFGAIAVMTSALVRVLPRGLDFLALNLVALFVIGSSAGAAVWIARLYRRDRAS
ncbi:MAG TPA: DUF2157 domain-containing protein [Gammaproteobacteria bacterium]|nr:DUF2157 domain-containing protein [Gammaproteobacteria bacterium]